MMLICMAWHRHLASRYGGSTFFCHLSLSPLVLMGGFHRSSRSRGRGEEPLYRQGFFLGGINHGRYPACWRHSLRYHEERGGRHGFGVAQAHNTSFMTRAESRGLTTTGRTRQKEEGKALFCRLGWARPGAKPTRDDEGSLGPYDP
jgi:hypothetical protein